LPVSMAFGRSIGGTGGTCEDAPMQVAAVATSGA
jgi:hypothetical protein